MRDLGLISAIDGGKADGRRPNYPRIHDDCRELDHGLIVPAEPRGISSCRLESVLADDIAVPSSSSLE